MTDEDVNDGQKLENERMDDNGNKMSLHPHEIWISTSLEHVSLDVMMMKQLQISNQEHLKAMERKKDPQ